MPPLMLLNETTRGLIVKQLQEQIPELLYAGLDFFPLAGGLEVKTNQFNVLAVCSIPVKERLRHQVADRLDGVISGQPKQLAARHLLLELGNGEVASVCWHDVVDYGQLLLKSSPSCVDSLQIHGPSLCFISPRFQKVKRALGMEWLLDSRQSRRYRAACAGPLLSLVGGKGAGSKAKRNIESPQRELTREEHWVATGLAKLALGDDSSSPVSEAVALMTKRTASSTSEWLPLARVLMQEASAAPEFSSAEGTMAIDAWLDTLREEDFEAFVSSGCSMHTCSLSFDPIPLEWEERLHKSWPAGADLIFLVQSGSFLYDLNTSASDADYSLIFLSPTRSLASRVPPSCDFQSHAQVRFGSDKSGEIEYTGKELGQYIVELSKGNPRNVELLFTQKPHQTSSVWKELQERRCSFLTLRCAGQYLGFISDRLGRATSELENIMAGEEGANARLAKLLYHAYHKIFELKRLLAGQEPMVALVGEEKRFVMDIRLRWAESLEEAQAQVEQAVQWRDELAQQLVMARGSGALPAEVDAAALAAWVESVRVRQAGTAPGDPVKPKSDPLPEDRISAAGLGRSSTRSSGRDDFESLAIIVEEVEALEGVRIVHAAYAPSSRTMQTHHEKSDHDIHCIFVLPHTAYMGLSEPIQKFSRSFPSAGSLTQVDVSGWEARHACRMLAQHNPSVLHALHSPVPIKTTSWTFSMRSLSEETIDRAALALAFWKHGKQNFVDYIRRSDQPKRKRYVHVLRPLLSLKWLLLQDWHVHCGSRLLPPPAILDLATELAGAASLETESLKLVAELVAEKDRLAWPAPKDKKLDQLIEQLIAESEVALANLGIHVRKAAPADPAHVKATYEQWNKLCVEMVSEVSASLT